jgi:hypothetical protein
VVQKPLIALSIGHLIRDESEVQERLEAEFKRAIDWDAILLLDEADIVLEARSFEDLRRNSIVSGKSCDHATCANKISQTRYLLTRDIPTQQSFSAPWNTTKESSF